MRIAIYTGHWAADGGGYGGGEHHVAQFASILSNYYEVDLYVGPQFNVRSTAHISEAFGIDLSQVNVVPFMSSSQLSNAIMDQNVFKKYDTFINMDHMILMPPLAHRNIVSTFFPQHAWDVGGYDEIIGNSLFTTEHAINRWKNAKDLKANVVYPPVNLSNYQYTPNKKNIITSIGRFFHVPDGNNKNHAVMIDAFKAMDLPDYELHLVGSIQHQDYYEQIRARAGDDERIKFEHDLSQEELVKLLAVSQFYWHATGYNTDLPSMKEHFGIVAIEAAASGAVPIVHNSGGMPESGALTWETPEELIGITKSLATQPEALKATQRAAITEVHEKFSLEASIEMLVNVIENPLVVVKDHDTMFHRPASTIYQVYSPPGKKICLVSDSPVTTTGFGNVAEQIIVGLKNSGHDVFCIGLLQNNTLPYKDDIKIYRPGAGSLDVNYFAKVIIEEHPDVMILSYESGHVHQWLAEINKVKDTYRPKIISYFPIEGWPLSQIMVDIVKGSDAALTYTNFGAALYADSEGEWLPVGSLGVDHSSFFAADKASRELWRSGIGWQDKFILGFFGRNKRTKQQGQLLRVVKILKEDYGMDDILLYLHCKGVESYGETSWEGIDIPMWARAYEIEKHVILPMFQDQANTSVPAHYDNKEGLVTLDQAYQAGAIDLRQLAVQRLNIYSLVQRYNCLDVFVSMSQGEGFGLPQAEAMACGIPMVYLADDGAQQEVIGDAGISVDPVSREPWKVGIELPVPDAHAFAEVIAYLRDNPVQLEEMSRRSIMRASNYTWFDLHNTMSELVNQVLQEYNK